jgi:uncharacterized cupin superfamily protein
VSGPGRFILLSTDAPGPYIAVYPDSDKVAVAVDERNVLVLPRSASLDYWHGEGTEGSTERVEPQREAAAPSRPVVNAPRMAVAADGAAFGASLGAAQLEATVLELDPGEAAGEYSYAHGREEWLLVLAGAATLRHPAGEDPLEASDLLCFPAGPSGAHQVTSRGDQGVRLLVFSTTGFPVNVFYPDSGSWEMRNGPSVDDVVAPE